MAVKPKPPKPTGSMIGGLPTYTQAQFQKVRPGGSYQSYLNFIKTRRGITKGPAWPGRGGPGLPTYMSMIRNVQMETPQQIEARTNRMVAAQVAAQRGLANDAAKQAQADANRLQQNLVATGNTVAEMNKGVFDQVGGAYNLGAQELGKMATGAVGAAGAATGANVAATNESLARLGMPGVEATGQMAGPAQAGVSTYLGGGLPAQNMVQQGSIANFGLAGLISSQNLRSEQEANAALTASTREIAQTKQQAYNEIARGRPQVAAQILESLQTAQRQQVALAMSMLEARRGALQAGFEQSQTKKEWAAEQAATAAATKQQQIENQQWTKSFNAAQEAAQRSGKQVDENRSIAFGYYVDQNGNPILKNGKRIPVPKTTAGTPSKAAQPVAQKMGASANYWVKDRLNRGKMTGTQQQLVAYLNAIYPGNPKLAARIAAATFPKGSGGKKFTQLKP